jgi:hypothetical protein
VVPTCSKPNISNGGFAIFLQHLFVFFFASSYFIFSLFPATIAALFKTHLRHEFPFDPVELLAFAFIG